MFILLQTYSCYRHVGILEYRKSECCGVGVTSGEMTACYKLHAGFMLGLFLAPKIAVTCSSEMSVDFQRTAGRCIPEDRTLHNFRCENLKSYTE
jgi:hypothetical protein